MAAITLTCPGCRHVVHVDEGVSARCPNCRAVVTAPEIDAPRDSEPSQGGSPTSEGTSDAAAGPPPTAPAIPPTEPGTSPLPTGHLVSDRAVSEARSASVVAFVFGLLIFVPLVPQVIAIVVGAIAILRPRKPRERITLAWIGLALGVLLIPCWIYALMWFASAVSSATAVRWTPPAGAVEAGAWDQAAAWQTEMQSVYAASAAYHRDFRRWPERIDVLVGRSLPRSFVPSPQLTYRPVPEAHRLSNSWLLMVSDTVRFDLVGEPLDSPHRFVLRLSGRIELLPAATVDESLAEQVGGATSGATADPWKAEDD